MLIHSKRAFIAILPAIIISALLLMVTLKSNLETLSIISHFDASIDKIESNDLVEGCFEDELYQLKQGNIFFGTTTDILGSSSCQINLTEASSIDILNVQSSVFQARSLIQASLLKTDFSVQSKKTF